MLSGDKSTVVKFVADKLGIDNAFGDLLPEDKVNKVKEIKGHNQTVAFAGDGVNDVPVVALSDVGIAMGGLGSDATIETADVVIQDDTLPDRNYHKHRQTNKAYRLAKYFPCICRKSGCTNVRGRWFGNHVRSSICRCWGTHAGNTQRR